MALDSVERRLRRFRNPQASNGSVAPAAINRRLNGSSNPQSSGYRPLASRMQSISSEAQAQPQQPAYQAQAPIQATMGTSGGRNVTPYTGTTVREAMDHAAENYGGGNPGGAFINNRFTPGYYDQETFVPHTPPGYTPPTANIPLFNMGQAGWMDNNNYWDNSPRQEGATLASLIAGLRGGK